jgi:hypothetical protein
MSDHWPFFRCFQGHLSFGAKTDRTVVVRQQDLYKFVEMLQQYGSAVVCCLLAYILVSPYLIPFLII